MQSQQLRVVQTNTKERIVRITERMTISTTKAKEVKKGSNNREGGGRGCGRVKGRFLLSFQDDKVGRGGNHSQEIEGSNLDTSYNNTTTIVVHQHDNTAQSRSKNEQELNANGKPDNASISPQQTGGKKR